MFDHIGTDPDEGAGRRRAVAGAWTALGAGAAVALAAAAGTWWVSEARSPAPLPAFVALVEPEPAVPDEPPPGLPDRPAGPLASGGGTPDAAPPPEVPPDDPAPLDAAVAPQIADAARGGPGPGDGPPGGGGGDGGGGGGGTDGPSRPRTVHATDLRARTRVEPVYPDAARALGLGTQRCVARIEIDADGKPARVEVTGCPGVFHRPTEDALRQWRWVPVRLGGERIPVVTTIAIVYRLD